MVKMGTDCNYRCRMCGSWKSEPETISKDKFKFSLQKIKGDLLFLSITGGEPFLNPEVIKMIVEETKEKNKNLKYISINTNCSLPEVVEKTVSELLEDFPDSIIFLGLHRIPNRSWGVEKTRIDSSYQNYKKTENLCKKLKKRYGEKFSFYKTLTISTEKDLSIDPKDSWINFAEINSFYGNSENDYIEELNPEDKLKYLRKYKKNKRSFLNKTYTRQLKKTIKKGKKRKCYAGINRVYMDSRGVLKICNRGVEKREKMNEDCSSCWTACEASFDLLNDFFLPF